MAHPSGGSFSFGPNEPMTPAEARRRHELIEQEMAEHEDLVLARLRAEFPDQTNPQVTSLVLPLSGLTVEWRTDGHWRVLDPDDDTSHEDLEPVWQMWDVVDGGFSRYSQVTPGDSPLATWWAVAGAAGPADEVSAWLADDTDVPVRRVGGLWIAEWVSVPQAAFVQINGDVHRFPALRPLFLPSGTHPFSGFGPNPRD